MLRENCAEKLSALQGRILLDALAGEIGAERTRRGKWGASDRAVFSRALRRLEARGLVVIGEHKRGRAACATLTQAGQEIAEDLRGDNLPSIAELQAQGERQAQARQNELARLWKTNPVSVYRLEHLLARAFVGVPLNWHAVALTMQGKRPRARRNKRGAGIWASIISQGARLRAS